MKQAICNHCGMPFDEQLRSCPNCDTPTPRQKERETAGIQRKFIRYFLIIVVFCVIMMLWLPREL